MNPPRLLVACEFSGIVRDAFKAVGWDSWSCDLLPTERPGQHIQDDVLRHLNDGWDMMIAHPPCTYLCNSGVRWLKSSPERVKLKAQAIEFVKYLWNSQIEKVCLENPVGSISTILMKPSQIIQPWDHGHPEWKTTCLWLRGLPMLQPSVITFPEDATQSRIHRMPPSKNRWKERSRTYEGIAKAMAQQWGLWRGVGWS